MTFTAPPKALLLMALALLIRGQLVKIAYVNLVALLHLLLEVSQRNAAFNCRIQGFQAKPG